MLLKSFYYLFYAIFLVSTVVAVVFHLLLANRWSRLNNQNIRLLFKAILCSTGYHYKRWLCCVIHDKTRCIRDAFHSLLVSNNKYLCLLIFFFFPSVNVKWGKEKFDAIELNTEEPPMVFKAQLFALTGVQPERQKVMVKGGTLKVKLLSRFSLQSVNLDHR